MLVIGWAVAESAVADRMLAGPARPDERPAVSERRVRVRAPGCVAVCGLGDRHALLVQVGARHKLECLANLAPAVSGFSGLAYVVANSPAGAELDLTGGAHTRDRVDVADNHLRALVCRPRDDLGPGGSGNLDSRAACRVTCVPESVEPVVRSCLCWGHDEFPFTDGYLCAGFRLSLPGLHLCSAEVGQGGGAVHARDATGRPNRHQGRRDAVTVSSNEMGDQLSSAH